MLYGEGDYFNGDDDYNFEYEDGFIPDPEADMEEVVSADFFRKWKESEVALKGREVNVVMLREAVQLLERSWFWRFRSLKSKVRMIADTYNVIQDLVVHD